MEEIEEFSKIFRVIGFLGILACSAFFLNRFVSNRRKSFNSLKRTVFLFLKQDRLEISNFWWWQNIEAKAFSSESVLVRYGFYPR